MRRRSDRGSGSSRQERRLRKLTVREARESAPPPPTAPPAAAVVPQPSRDPSRLLPGLLAAGILALGVLGYLGTGRFDFVNLDDPAYVYENPTVLSEFNADSLRWSMTSGTAGNWHPLTWWSHMAVAAAVGSKPAAHHLLNVGLHAANALLLFVVFWRMTCAPWRSALVAALFALHPLHVESVAWVSARKDVLSALFWWLTIWAYLGWVRRPSALRYALISAAFVAGLMSKPMLVTLPCALLLFDVWPLNRIRRERWSADLTQRVVEKLPLFALGFVFSLVALNAQRGAGAVQSLEVLSLPARLANAGVAYVVYLRKAVWPANLAVYYPYQAHAPLAVVVALGLLAAVSFAAVRLFRRAPYLLVGWLYFLGTLLPVIGLVQIGDQALADRYTYLPLTGIFIAVAWGLHDLTERLPARAVVRGLVALACVAAIMGCLVQTRRQLATWRDSRSLYLQALDVTRDNYFVHAMFGNALLRVGAHEEAVLQLEQALRLKPSMADAHDNLGLAYSELGRMTEAAGHYTAALRIDATRVRTYNNLGVLLARTGRLPDAVSAFRNALRLAPNDGEARRNLARAERMLVRTPADAAPDE